MAANGVNGMMSETGSEDEVRGWLTDGESMAAARRELSSSPLSSVRSLGPSEVPDLTEGETASGEASETTSGTESSEEEREVFDWDLEEWDGEMRQEGLAVEDDGDGETVSEEATETTSGAEDNEGEETERDEDEDERREADVREEVTESEEETGLQDSAAGPECWCCWALLTEPPPCLCSECQIPN